MNLIRRRRQRITSQHSSSSQPSRCIPHLSIRPSIRSLLFRFFLIQSPPLLPCTQDPSFQHHRIVALLRSLQLDHRRCRPTLTRVVRGRLRDGKIEFRTQRRLTAGVKSSVAEPDRRAAAAAERGRRLRRAISRLTGPKRRPLGAAGGRQRSEVSRGRLSSSGRAGGRPVVPVSPRRLPPPRPHGSSSSSSISRSSDSRSVGLSSDTERRFYREPQRV